MKEHKEPAPAKTETLIVRLSQDEYSALLKFMQHIHTTNRSKAVRRLIRDARETENLRELLREAERRGKEREKQLTDILVQLPDLQERIIRLEWKNGSPAGGIN